MPQTSINTFSEGMVTDVDKSLKSSNSYQHAANMRYLANINDNTGTLHSVESSSILISLDSDEFIIGHQVIREYLVLFTSKFVSGSPNYRSDKITRYTIDGSGLTSPFTVFTGDDFFSDTIPTDSSDLPEYLSTVGRWEADDNVKVYWSSSEKNIRVTNVMESSVGLDPDRFNLLANFDKVSPVLSNIVSGNLNSGRVDYSYSLLKENGQESVISGTLSGSKVNLFSDNIVSSSTVNVKGDSETTGTGKGVELNITISADDASFYDKIRLYRIHYSDYGQLPTIIIVGDYDIINSGIISLIDIGSDSLGTYTIEEFSILNSIPYTAYTIEEKDNVLFAANVSEEVFDVNFDARAYRFDEDETVNVPQARLFASYGSYTTPEYIINGDDPTVDTGGYTSWLNIPETANCLNAYNDIDNDGDHNYEFLYQKDGLTVGGEGPEVKYEFEVVSTQLDIDNTSTLSESRTYSGNLNSSVFLTTDYSSPIATYYYTTYQRDEVYRFGLKFFNKSGLETPVKWIGDIRFPGPGPSTFNNLVDTASLHTIRISFTLKNGLPSGASSFEIVRAERTENDKTIVAAGYIGGSFSQYIKTRVPVVNSTAYNVASPRVSPAASINSRLFSFISPEILFSENLIIKQGDYVDIVGTLSNYISSIENSGLGTYPLNNIKNNNNNWYSVKYRTNTFHTGTIDRYTINDIAYINGESSVKPYAFSTAPSGTMFNAGIINEGTTGDWDFGSSGRCVALEFTADFDDTNYTHFNLPYVYIKRNNLERYGGSTYQSRLRTKYISASGIDSIVTVTSSKGDTYINYFDYLNYTHDKNYSDDMNALLLAGASNVDDLAASFVIFPVESKLNLSLRHDDHYAKVYGSRFSYLMKENAGLQEENPGGAGVSYFQETDLYLYNSIYSQEQNISYSFPLLEEFRSEFDTRVIYSDKKFNDEYIDSWTKFRANNFLDVESRHGAIKSLIKNNNYLYFAQDDAFGVLSVNQRSLVGDNNTGSLALGTGGTLDRFDYITEHYGVQHKKSITSCKGGVYFYDKERNSIVNSDIKNTIVLSDAKGLKSYLNNLTVRDVPFVTSNNKESEVYFTIGTNPLVYNNFTGNFISEYTNDINYIGDVSVYSMYTINGDSSNQVYNMYNGSTYGSFNNVDYNDSSITLSCNEAFTETKTFDNVLFYTSSKLSDVERNTDLIDSITFWNDYQYSGYDSSAISGSSNIVLGDNIQRRERGYSLSIPRNVLLNNGTDNSDIFDPLNQDITRPFRERMRDKYITTKLNYENSATKGQISLPYIVFSYRKSYR